MSKTKHKSGIVVQINYKKIKQIFFQSIGSGVKKMRNRKKLDPTSTLPKKQLRDERTPSLFLYPERGSRDPINLQIKLNGVGGKLTNRNTLFWFDRHFSIARVIEQNEIKL